MSGNVESGAFLCGDAALGNLAMQR